MKTDSMELAIETCRIWTSRCCQNGFDDLARLPKESVCCAVIALRLLHYPELRERPRNEDFIADTSGCLKTFAGCNLSLAVLFILQQDF